jgi:methanogenic corrinoid protein MtbC1
MSKIQEIAEMVETGKAKVIEGLVSEALAEGLDAVKILNEGMVAAMGRVGERFQKGEIYVPEMLIAARTMKKGVEVLKPKLAGVQNLSLGKCIIGTVHGDLHDIGKNLVGLMIESAGFELIDLGVDVQAQAFVDAVNQNPDAKIVALSALLTTTMPALQETVAALKAAGCKAKVIIGGAPVTEDFAKKAGADGYAPDAASAAIEAKRFI